MVLASGDIVLWSLSAGVSAACFGYALVTMLQAAREEARQVATTGSPRASSPLFRLTRPVGRFLGALTIGIWLRVEKAAGRPPARSNLNPVRDWLDKRLRCAAYPEGVTSQEFIGLMVLGGALFGLFGVGVNVRMQFGPIIVVFILTGMYLPLVWLRGRVQARQDEIRKALPYALDLLTLSVEAGLDFTQALSRIVKKLTHGALAVELGQTVRDIQLGRTRPQALRELGHRVDVPELNSIVTALIQADELGSSLGPILRIQAEQLRTRRSQMAEKTAMEAPVKILLPLIFFIFPTIFIMLFGPIVLKVMKD
jgi:tight adherence protein C